MCYHLVSSGLVFRRGAPPHATFVFKHALVRDAAYDMLVRERRRQLHAQVAQALELKFPTLSNCSLSFSLITIARRAIPRTRSRILQ